QAGFRRVDDVVGEEHRERLVADSLARLERGMTEPEWLRLMRFGELHGIVVPTQRREQGVLSFGLEMTLEVLGGLEVIEHERFSRADDDDNLLNSRGDRLLDDHLDRRCIYHRQNL